MTLTRLLQTKLIVLAAAGCVSAIGCGGEEAPPATTDGPSPRTLAIGDQGEDVEKLHDYLTKYGYFPNDDLRDRYPGWVPIVEDRPIDPLVFDETTAAALRNLQARAGLLPTGVFDRPTQDLVGRPRCGVPDGMEPLVEFATGIQVAQVVHWWVNNNNDVTRNEAVFAAGSAILSWQNESARTFTQSPFQGTMGVTFQSIDGPGNTLGATSGVNITVDSDDTWSTASPTPGGMHDLQTTLLHEMGHALGMFHSSVRSATMYPFDVGTDRTLDLDDRVAISSLYDDQSVTFPMAMQDVAVGRDGSIWAIAKTTSDGNVYKWNGTAWVFANGAGKRIAVERDGNPWVVTAAGAIWRKPSSEPAGGWSPIAGGANDVGAGWDGSVWVIGSGSGDTGIFKFNGSGWDQSSGGATRIAVGEDGHPWIVTSGGAVFRRTSNSPTEGVWENLSTGAIADIGIADGNYAWAEAKPIIFGSKGNVAYYVWNEQSFLDAGGGVNDAPSRRQWNRVFSTMNAGTGTAVGIAVGPGARPYMIGMTGTLSTPSK